MLFGSKQIDDSLTLWKASYARLNNNNRSPLKETVPFDCNIRGQKIQISTHNNISFKLIQFRTEHIYRLLS